MTENKTVISPVRPFCLPAILPRTHFRPSSRDAPGRSVRWSRPVARTRPLKNK